MILCLFKTMFRSQNVVILTCVFSLRYSFSFPGQILGPAAFIFQTFEHCDPPVTEVDLWITQRKLNRTTNVLDMRLSTPWPLGDDVIMDVQTAIKKDGGYKPGAFYLKGQFCQTLKTLVGGLYNAIFEAAGVEDCPLPSTEIKSFHVDSDNLHDQMLYGEYRAELKFYVEEKLRGCYRIYVNLVPKED